MSKNTTLAIKYDLKNVFYKLKMKLNWNCSYIFAVFRMFMVLNVIHKIRQISY